DGGRMSSRSRIQPQEVDARLAPHVLVVFVGQVLGRDRAVARAARDLRSRYGRVVDEVEVVVSLVGLVCGRPDLRPSAHERVARVTGRGRVSTLADYRARAEVGGIVGLEGNDELRGRERLPAIRRPVVGDRIRGLVAAHVGELAIGDVDVAITGHRDVRELDVVHRLAQLERARERLSVIGRADEVDARVEAARTVAGKPRPGEIDVAVARAARAIDLDRGLVVELAEQVRGGRALPHSEGANEPLAVRERGTVHAGRVLVRGDPDVAERLRASISGI